MPEHTVVEAVILVVCLQVMAEEVEAGSEVTVEEVAVVDSVEAMAVEVEEAEAAAKD